MTALDVEQRLEALRRLQADRDRYIACIQEAAENSLDENPDIVACALATILGHPVEPGLLVELGEAIEEERHARDHVEGVLRLQRVDALTRRLLAGPPLPGERALFGTVL